MYHRHSESIDKFEDAASRVQRSKGRPAQVAQQRIVVGSLISLIILAAQTDEAGRLCRGVEEERGLQTII